MNMCRSDFRLESPQAISSISEDDETESPSYIIEIVFCLSLICI